MRARTLARIAGAALLLAVPALAAETYEVDPVHSAVIFRVGHLGVSHTYGRFNDISGQVVLDAADPSKSSVEITVKADSVDTFSEKRDQHLKSPDFFNAKQFPELTFKSRSVKKTGESEFEVAGDLTLHGVTRPVTVKVQHLGSGSDPWGGYRAGFETTFDIRRSDFGMDYMPGGVSDEVRLIVAVEGVRK
jgi:polyisoprenoid-binding protein YceI